MRLLLVALVALIASLVNHSAPQAHAQTSVPMWYGSHFTLQNGAWVRDRLAGYPMPSYSGQTVYGYWHAERVIGSAKVGVTYPTFQAPKPAIPAVSGGCFGVVPAVAAITGIPASILRGLVRVESGGSSTVLSSDGYGSIGCLQAIPSTFAAYAAPGCTDPYNPYCNVLAGARYLLACLRIAGGNMTTALAMYNGGPSNPQFGYAAHVLSLSY